MSLQEHAALRGVIDLTHGPVIDLNRASYFAEDQAALAEAANRLLLDHRYRAAGASVIPGGYPPARRPRIHARVNVMTITMITVIATVSLLLMGLVATAH